MKLIDKAAVSELKNLYEDIDKCIGDLVLARSKHDQRGISDAHWKMETLMVNTQQVLSYILQYLEVKEIQEEPVSEELEEASKYYALNNTPWDDCVNEIQESFKEGAKWQREQMQYRENLEVKKVDLELNFFDATVCKIGSSTYLKEMDKDAIIKVLEPYKDGDKVKVIIKTQKGE